MTETKFNTLNVSRRGLLTDATLLLGAGVLLGAGLTSPAVAGSKFSQKMAHYQPTPKGASRCDTCSQFTAPSACKVVDGAVQASGWCLLFAAK